jgi:hypothetical protein
MIGKGSHQTRPQGRGSPSRVGRFFRASLRLGALALAVTAAGGCGADFAPFNRVTGLRVLGIQSDPPTPLSGETATFRALVVTPSWEPAPPLTYQWSWCPLGGASSNGYKCPFVQKDVDAFVDALEQPPLPRFDLGTEPTATFTNDIPAAVFDLICSGKTILPGQSVEFSLDCSAGFPIQIMLTVSSDTDTLTAVQSAKLRFDPATPANTNPTMDGLSAVLGPPNMLMPMPIVPSAADGPLVTLPRQTATKLQVDMSESVAEVYLGKDDDGNPATLTERLFLTWFIETGDTNDMRTSFYSGSTNFRDLLTNDWTPGPVKNYPTDTARLFVVAHDNRGGVSWRTGTVNLGPPP